VDQCLPLDESSERDWVLWVELWLRAVRHPELRPVAEELYRRMRDWFADAIAAGVEDGEFKRCDPEEVADRAGYTRPHTVHCGPEGIYIAALGNTVGEAPFAPG